MRFLMLVCVADMLPIPEDADLDPTPWVDAETKAGRRVTGDGTLGGDNVRVVRVRDGETRVTVGPVAGAADYIGGFDILECASIEEAITVAAAHPLAAYGALEIRPFWAGPSR